MRELRDALKQCVERLDRSRRHPRRLGEQNTKASLIEPIIDALGWDIYDPDEVHREYRRRSSDNPVDYALLLVRTPRLFIEAKGLGENLDDPRWANQTISYAAVAGVEWVVLTDGSQWRIYNAHAPVPIEQKLFRTVHIGDDLDAAVDLLCLLSKEYMRENRIDEMWKGFFVDRQVRAELIELFSGGEPAPELISLLDQRLSKLSRNEIRASLTRARATFDFPIAATSLGMPPQTTTSHPAPAAARPMSPQPPATHDPTMPATASPARKPVKPRVSPEERRIRVVDMIAAGRLKPGSPLIGFYLGQRHETELLADGQVRYNGRMYASLSAAGAAVKTELRGPDIPDSVLATDGMDFWSAKDEKSGDLVKIKEIRRRTAQDLHRNMADTNAIDVQRRHSDTAADDSATQH